MLHSNESRIKRKYWAIGVITGLFLITLPAAMKPVPEPILQQSLLTSNIPQIKEEKEHTLTAHDKRQIQCLAEVVYFEAGNQEKRGQIAVSNVVMNRVKDNRFPSTPCGVVYQRSSKLCQFSWVCQKKRVRDWNMFNNAKLIAEEAYIKGAKDVTGGAKFFHAAYVRPNWPYTRTATIGEHIFYRG